MTAGWNMQFPTFSAPTVCNFAFKLFKTTTLFHLLLEKQLKQNNHYLKIVITSSNEIKALHMEKHQGIHQKQTLC